MEILAVIALVLFVFGCVDVYLWGHVSDNTRANKKNATAIQRNRLETAEKNCQDQNKKHDDTSNSLILAAAKDENRRHTEAGKQEVRRRRDVTLGLIDLLAPKQDCQDIVNQLKVVQVSG